MPANSAFKLPNAPMLVPSSGCLRRVGSLPLSR